jgi:hypothetical protein
MHKIRKMLVPILQKQFSWEVKVPLKTKKCFANKIVKFILKALAEAS